jgi:hypothetical protein
LSRFWRSLKRPMRAESLAEFRPSGVCKLRTPPHVRSSFANMRAGCRSAPMGRNRAGTENMRSVVCICVTQLPTHVTASPDQAHLGMKCKIKYVHAQNSVGDTTRRGCLEVVSWWASFRIRADVDASINHISCSLLFGQI